MRKDREERLLESFRQALEHAEGKRNLKTTVLIKLEPMSKEEIIALRNKMNCSQAVFANRLNVSPKTVQAWEQGRDTPKGAALRLLSIAKEQPEILAC
jgi:putative transcriptional regulator